jgi:predicted DNA-binding protein YlxM (UPF0122 family)
MKDRVYLNNLYDYYSNLLTETQKKYFESYYFDNLSLGEIAENIGCSRNAIHLTIKTTVKKLNEFEKSLGLYKRSEMIDKYKSEIEDEKVLEMLESLR